ncbi:tetratricopeptide repeat protein [Serinibacter arcticus]|uniref:tetratricopeptide repeat protein n=1 Tax=Serinibacter arcticus TaxID=1655435 RepID=UPI000D643E2F
MHEVIEALRRAVAAAPQDVTLRLHLADQLVAVGDVPAALTEIAVAIQLDPADPRTHDAVRRALDAGSAAPTTTADQGLAPSAPEPPAPTASSSPPRRRRHRPRPPRPPTSTGDARSRSCSAGRTRSVGPTPSSPVGTRRVRATTPPRTRRRRPRRRGSTSPRPTSRSPTWAACAPSRSG